MSSIIYTTGAFLEPIKIPDKEGNDVWRWVVSEFIDDSFKDGEIFNPLETAQSREILIVNES
ncbi:hypothetical protein TRIP_D300067 [uncultured Paludibacter sp.]|nr:hypothetical protein TRIP_D300067 [uncultured Paludibacter sp.]